MFFSYFIIRLLRSGLVVFFDVVEDVEEVEYCIFVFWKVDLWNYCFYVGFGVGYELDEEEWVDCYEGLVFGCELGGKWVEDYVYWG